MIEQIENGLQIATLAVCGAAALIRALRRQNKPWTLLVLFYGSWLLGDVYWAVCLLFYGETPRISLVSDLSWYASFIFLYMLLREAAPPLARRERRILPWLGPAFALGMNLFFMQWGEVVSNLVYAGLMGLVLFSSIRRLMDRGLYPRARFLCFVILGSCLLEYALWTVSCFWDGDTLSNPYYWIDFLLTASFILYLPATAKALAPEPAPGIEGVAA